MIDFGKSVDQAASIMDAMAVRARVIAHNVANQNTPGYKRYTVQFEDALASAHADGRGAQTVRPVVVRDASGSPGENNVSVVEELALLEKVKMMYDIFSRRAGGYFAHVNRAIFGR